MKIHVAVMNVCDWQVGAIIITPTRELAQQIDEVLSHFLKFVPQFSHTLLVGGGKPEHDLCRLAEQG